MCVSRRARSLALSFALSLALSVCACAWVRVWGGGWVFESGKENGTYLPSELAPHLFGHASSHADRSHTSRLSYHDRTIPGDTSFVQIAWQLRCLATPCLANDNKRC
jgi:hypothetical protein